MINRTLVNELSNSIVAYVESKGVVTPDSLLDWLQWVTDDATTDEIKHALSEVIQANRIKRIEYLSESKRREFYAPLDFRLV